MEIEDLLTGDDDAEADDWPGEWIPATRHNR